MSGAKRNQSSISSFFKPLQQQVSSPVTSTATATPTTTPTSGTASMPSSSQVSSLASFKAPYNLPHLPFGNPKSAVNSNNVEPVPAKPAANQEYISGLCPPPSSSILSDPPISSPEPNLQSVPISAETRFEREVKGSDDEADDSDSEASLADLSTLLKSHSSKDLSKISTDRLTPTTPIHPKATRNARFHTSPLPVLPKYKFDLKSLARHAEKDNATEASSKRVKAMLIPTDETYSANPPPAATDFSITKISQHKDLLESVVTETEGGEMNKVTRALKRTEATLLEYQWYFFQTEENISEPSRTPFPVKSLTKDWRDDLKDPQMRYQTFVSDFAEDMVGFGKTLPDEIFMWMIDELCSEPTEVLRKSYCNILRASTEQLSRLVDANVVQGLFQRIGGTSTGTTISEVVHPVQGIIDPYRKRKWAKLHSLVGFLGQASKHFQPQQRSHIVCMLLRMGIDRVVFNNLDLYDLVQDTIYRLCRHVPDDVWETFCQEICETMFDTVVQPTFRLHVVETLSSVSPRTHDLRRRLAMCFYFDDIRNYLRHSHHVMDLNLFIERLDAPAFDANSETDYRELAALILLLDIAVDDARSLSLDLADRRTEGQFDEDIEAFAASIKDIIRNIGIPGPGFISKIEAKEVLELVSQRIADTLRSRPKPKQTLWNTTAGKTKEDLAGEKDAMKRFLAGRKSNATSSRASPEKD